MNLDTRVPVVVVSYLGGNGHLGIARSLGRLGIPTYLVVHDSDTSPVSRSRYWIRTFRWDFTSSKEKTAQFLLDIGRRIEIEHEAKPILLTTADWMAIFIEDSATVLAKHFVFPRPGHSVIGHLANKWEMAGLARRHGIPTPETSNPQSRDELLAFLSSAEFPLVVKPANPYAEHAPPKQIVHSAAELLRGFETTPEPFNCIIQEYIPGDADSVWMCNAYFDGESRCRAVMSGRKLRQVSETGIASLAVLLPNDTVEKQTRALLQAVGYSGCVGVGYRFDARDGLYKLLDVNPRVSGIFRLFRASNGMDVVRLCYLDLTGQKIPALVPSIGRKWLLESDVAGAFAALRGRRLTLRQWIGSLRGVRETQWFAPDDPKPAVIWVVRGIRQQLVKRLRSAWTPGR